MSTEVTYTVTGTVHNHPWHEEDKTYVTQVWEFASFDLTEIITNKAIEKAKHISGISRQ